MQCDTTLPPISYFQAAAVGQTHVERKGSFAQGDTTLQPISPGSICGPKMMVYTKMKGSLVQGDATLQPISRFQAAAVGQKIYIHTHRSINDILVLDVTNPDKPQLQQVAVSGADGATPSARYEQFHTLNRVMHDCMVLHCMTVQCSKV